MRHIKLQGQTTTRNEQRACYGIDNRLHINLSTHVPTTLWSTTPHVKAPALRTTTSGVGHRSPPIPTKRTHANHVTAHEPKTRMWSPSLRTLPGSIPCMRTPAETYERISPLQTPARNTLLHTSSIYRPPEAGVLDRHTCPSTPSPTTPISQFGESIEIPSRVASCQHTPRVTLTIPCPQSPKITIRRGSHQGQLPEKHHYTGSRET